MKIDETKSSYIIFNYLQLGTNSAGLFEIIFFRNNMNDVTDEP